MAILQHYNIPAQKSNKKIGDQNELLLKHCHSFLSVPITFVPDCSIENYSEAPEQKKSTLPDKQLNEFVPVAFVMTLWLTSSKHKKMKQKLQELNSLT